MLGKSLPALGWTPLLVLCFLLSPLLQVNAVAGCCWFLEDCATGWYECEIYCDGSYPNCIVYENCQGQDVIGSGCASGILSCAGQYIECNGSYFLTSCECDQTFDRNTCPPNLTQCLDGDPPCHWDMHYILKCDTPNPCC